MLLVWLDTFQINWQFAVCPSHASVDIRGQDLVQLSLLVTY
jgi:hypothetical protein